MTDADPIEARKSRIQRITNAYREAFGGLSLEQLNYSPDPSTWSIAQNIEHVMVLNGTYFPIFSQLKEGSYKPPFMAKFGFLARWTGQMLLKYVDPDRKKKMKTFSVWEPKAEGSDEHLLDRFEEQQKDLSQALEDLKGPIERGAIIASPANRKIVYPLGKAFDIILSHEERHLEQAKELLG